MYQKKRIIMDTLMESIFGTITILLIAILFFISYPKKNGYSNCSKCLNACSCGCACCAIDGSCSLKGLCCNKCTCCFGCGMSNGNCIC